MPSDANGRRLLPTTALLEPWRARPACCWKDPWKRGSRYYCRMKKWALAHRWAYAASGVDFAAGPALAMTGQIGEGIRMLKAAILACDATGSLAVASWNRLSLAELYLGMLSARAPRPPIRFILFNLLSIVKVRLFGLRQVRRLLEQLSSNSQIHPESTTRARIELDLARVCLKENARGLARQHLAKARSAALTQDSTLMLNEIDAIAALVAGF